MNLKIHDFRNSKYLYVVLLFLLFAISVTYLFGFKKIASANTILKKYLDICQSNNETLVDKNKYLENYIDFVWKCDSLSFNKDLVVYDEDGKSLQLGELVKKDKILIFKYTKLGCNVCTESQLTHIHEFIMKHGKYSVVLFSDYEESRSIKVFKTKNDIKLKIYRFPYLNSFFSELSVPIYFIIDKSFNASMFCLTNKNFPEDTDNYFSKIEQLITD